MRDYLKNLAADLLTLEVNTIVKEQTTSSKMPATKRVALLEIARGYRELLVDYGLALLEKPAENRAPCLVKQPLVRARSVSKLF